MLYTQRSILLLILLLTTNAFAQKEGFLTDCSVGIIEIEASQGNTDKVETGGNILKKFDRRITANDLFNLVSGRFNFDAAEKYQCDDDKLLKALYLLSEVKDERIFPHLLEVSKSSCPNSCDAAVGDFRRLGDKRALPRLREILHINRSCSSAAAQLIGEIGDETAIPDLIDTIPAGGANDADVRLAAIEKITGLSLVEIRKKWGLIYGSQLEQFHKAMYDWREKNRQQIRKK